MLSHKSSSSFRYKLAMSAIVLIGVIATAFAINAQGWLSRSAPSQAVTTLNDTAVAEVSQQAVRQGLLNAKLAVQPEANRMRRR